MMRALKTAALAALLGLLMVPWAHAADLNADYLVGRWVLGAQDCKSPDIETIEFRKNGTYESIRSGEVQIVGFWRIDQDLVELNMVTSPAYFSDIDPRLESYKDLYNYFQSKVAIFNIQEDSFEAVGVMGHAIERTRAVKCR